MGYNLEDHLRQLRYLIKALRLVANDMQRDQDPYVGEAIEGIAWEMGERIEAAELAAFGPPRSRRQIRAQIKKLQEEAGAS
jgi:hypothetical protein